MKKNERVVKPYEELQFSDDFMFGKVMQDKKLCHDVLECLLQRPIGELEDVQPEKEYKQTTDGKPIRLDIYTRDSETVYDAEMQNLNNRTVESLELPRRTRFYQSAIDEDHIKKGQSYRLLPDSAILFICTFDPFGKGLSQYTFRCRCDEDSDVCIDDGAVRVFYNCRYEGDNIPDTLRKLYDYIATGKTGNELTERIEDAVEVGRKIEEWRSEYVKERIIIEDAREEGREEGREEERINTENERKRADEAEARATNAETELKRYRAAFGELV